MSKKDEYIQKATDIIMKTPNLDMGEDIVKSEVASAIELAKKFSQVASDYMGSEGCGDMAVMMAIALSHSCYTGIHTADQPGIDPWDYIGDEIANMGGAWGDMITLLNAAHEDYREDAFNEEC